MTKFQISVFESKLRDKIQWDFPPERLSLHIKMFPLSCRFNILLAAGRRFHSVNEPACAHD